jgi:DNA-binding NarL/FixJ family response regulator
MRHGVRRAVNSNPWRTALTAPIVVVTSPGLQRDALFGGLAEPSTSPVRWVTHGATDLVEATQGAALVLFDLDAPNAGGIAGLRALSASRAAPAVVALSQAEDEAFIEEVVQAGACAYVPRSYTETQLLAVVQLALSGAGHRPVMPGRHARDSAAQAHAASCAEHQADAKLTPKQVEVLSLAADGLSNRQIATRLGIAEGTVKLHLSAIYLKLNVERRGEAIVLAHRMQEVRAQQMHQAARGEQVLQWLLPHVTHRRAKCGEVIFRTGDASSELFYIQSGQVRLEEIGVTMGPGQVMGEIGLFSPAQTRTCTAVCSTDVELFCLGSHQARSIYYLNPHFALHIVQLIAQRLLADRQRR